MRVRQKLLIHASLSEVPPPHSPRTHTCVVLWCVSHKDKDKDTGFLMWSTTPTFTKHTHVWCVLHKDKDKDTGIPVWSTSPTYTHTPHTHTKQMQINLISRNHSPFWNQTLQLVRHNINQKSGYFPNQNWGLQHPPSLSQPCMTSLAQGRPPLPRFLCKLTSTRSSC